jgi:hypothetical protein
MAKVRGFPGEQNRAVEIAPQEDLFAVWGDRPEFFGVGLVGLRRRLAML